MVKIEFKEERLVITDEDRAERAAVATNALDQLQNTAYNFFVTAQQVQDSNENVMIGTTEKLSEVFQLEDLEESEDGLIPRIFDVKDLAGRDGSLIISYDAADQNFDYLFIDKEPSAWKPAQDTQ